MGLDWIELNRPRTLACLIGTVVLIGGLILLCQFCGIMLCPLRKYTGIPCFTCGSTRALIALGTGDIHAAFLLQPLVVSLVVLMTPALAFNLCTAVLQKRILLFSLSRQEKIGLGLLLMTATLTNWLYLLNF